ncbi:cation transporter [Roseovarius sp. C7]|uniref:cation transporter n=1 Tax=Roseovarius sp. C7 TaxID=3398643 RepID=UPI0039F66512
MTHRPELPPDVQQSLDRAKRLEWWTLGWLASIVAVMAFAMGSSQAMQAAWIEDMLSLLPPILFLVAAHFEGKPASAAYPFGLDRLGSLCFLLAAAALTIMGGYLIYDAIHILATQEHPTIGSVSIFGHETWLGWLMIAALAYSVIPPVILGRKKRKLAPVLMDKVLYTDAEMNAADWKTGLAGIIGVLGIGLGFWWADALAAGIIGADILRDGLRALRISVAELLDGAPRKLSSPEISQAVDDLRTTVPGDRPVRVRETGRYLHVEIAEDTEVTPSDDFRQKALGEQGWRVINVTGPAPPETRKGKD